MNLITYNKIKGVYINIFSLVNNNITSLFYDTFLFWENINLNFNFKKNPNEISFNVDKE